MPDPDRKPLDDEIDTFGLTHQGKVRPNNQDQFLIAAIHKRADVWSTSLSPEHLIEDLQAVAFRTPLRNVLSSAIGGDSAVPVVTRLASEWYNVGLLCSDGLTKHVSDEKIAERLAAMTSSKQVAEQLLQDALDGGGTDNITIIVGRAVPKEGR